MNNPLLISTLQDYLSLIRESRQDKRGKINLIKIIPKRRKIRDEIKILIEKENEVQLLIDQLQSNGQKTV